MIKTPNAVNVSSYSTCLHVVWINGFCFAFCFFLAFFFSVMLHLILFGQFSSAGCYLDYSNDFERFLQTHLYD